MAYWLPPQNFGFNIDAVIGSLVPNTMTLIELPSKFQPVDMLFWKTCFPHPTLDAGDIIRISVVLPRFLPAYRKLRKPLWDHCHAAVQRNQD